MGLEPTSDTKAATCFRDRLLIQPDDFRKRVDSLLVASVSKLRGLESNQRPPDSESGVTTSSNCPAVFTKQYFHQGCLLFAKGSGRRIRTFIACFKGRWPTISRSPNGVCSTSSRSKSALRESDPPVRFGRPVPLPLGQGHVLSFRSCGGRNRTCDRAVNSRPPVPTRAPPQSHFHKQVGAAGFEPTISCFRSTRISKLSHTPITRRHRLLLQRSLTALRSTRRESNPHVRPGEAAGRRYITGALATKSDCQRAKSTG